MKKIIIIVSIVSLVAIAGYIALTKSSCSNLSQEECKANESCVGIYGSSLCNGNTCFADISFQGCKEIPKK